MNDSMRAQRFYADNGTVVIEDVAIPIAGPGEVLVKVAFCGICHSDLSLLDGTFPVSYTHLTLPTTLHECRSRWSPSH